ncbi:flavodoxin family protein [Clostridium grantii]|uniref:Multimeric flavodoxin WrbA n=1 Tax=Clostridium grantii DSM 8605 TaxID=1121316 RepID=A0A1M5SKF5_9CLOT|nr:flavodoxin family protein [Clostridium grantii]SHH38979.1 Multimeric flavodoxin WrbA [Clostridium grantii DSM 8605]
MKVVAFNGSPKKEGNTYQALKIVGEELEKQNIEFEILHVGNKNIRGCAACNMCAKNKNEKCIINDEVNDMIQKMKEADGIILGSPVYYAGIAGTMKAFLDRAFYVTSVNGMMLKYKVGASLAAVRRSGGIPTFDSLNHYITYSEMFMPASNYWNVVHGTKPGDVNEDEEGKQIARILGTNMAWLMKVVNDGKSNYGMPEKEKKVWTSFIR